MLSFYKCIFEDGKLISCCYRQLVYKEINLLKPSASSFGQERSARQLYFIHLERIKWICYWSSFFFAPPFFFFLSSPPCPRKAKWRWVTPGSQGGGRGLFRDCAWLDLRELWGTRCGRVEGQWSIYEWRRFEKWWRVSARYWIKRFQVSLCRWLFYCQSSYLSHEKSLSLWIKSSAVCSVASHLAPRELCGVSLARSRRVVCACCPFTASRRGS